MARRRDLDAQNTDRQTDIHVYARTVFGIESTDQRNANLRVVYTSCFHEIDSRVSPPPKPRAMGNFASHSHSHSRSIQSAEDRIAGHIGASGVAALRRVAECCCCCHRMQQEEQHSVLAEAMQVGHRFGNGKLSK